MKLLWAFITVVALLGLLGHYLDYQDTKNRTSIVFIVTCLLGVVLCVMEIFN